MKKAFKKIFLYVTLFVIVALFVCSAALAHQQSQLEVCKQVDLVILNSDSSTFVTREGIMKELETRNLFPEGKLIRSLDTDSIERALAHCDYLESVECYVSNINHLVIEVRQYVPVMRVYDRGDSTVYYVNRTGKRVAVDGRYHIDVPVVEGDFTGSFQPIRLLPLINYVDGDESLKGLVSMYVVRDSNNVCFVPTICGHIVNMGRVEGWESKFKKLRLFYDNVMSKKGWDAYTEVSLKWDYMVVGTLRGKKTPYIAPYNPEEDEQAPPIESIGIDEVVGNVQEDVNP